MSGENKHSRVIGKAMKHCKHEKVLLIDRGYTPLNIITWKRAMSLVYGRNKAEIIKSYSPQLGSERLNLRPSVIKLTVFSPHPSTICKKIKFHKQYVLIRDNYECQYCNKNLKNRRNEITIDHICPKSQGGKSNYTNCVTACRSCNQNKGDKTLAEAGLRLRRSPKKPSFGWQLHIKEHLSEWATFIPGVEF